MSKILTAAPLQNSSGDSFVETPEDMTEENESQEETQSEKDERLKGTGYPHMGYNMALSKWIVLSDGTIRNVRSCSAEEFIEYIKMCTHGTHRDIQKDCIAGLDADMEVGKCYALEMLQAQSKPRLVVPLFDNAKEASMSL